MILPLRTNTVINLAPWLIWPLIELRWSLTRFSVALAAAVIAFFPAIQRLQYVGDLSCNVHQSPALAG